LKIIICFGTRPEAIKMAPFVKACAENNTIETLVCVTAQHREMLDQVLHFFEIEPDIDLDLMEANQTLNQLSARIIAGMDMVLTKAQPDWVFVHGDTTTSTMVALSAFHLGIKVGHVEAGLRTYNKHSPFPEEINRQITGRIADAHFAPTKKAAEYLLNEGVDKDKIIITGNTVVDALKWGLEITKANPQKQLNKILRQIDFNKKIVLVTGHRRENFGQGFINVCEALVKIAERKDTVIIYPVHLNPYIKNIVDAKLANKQNIYLLPPVSYPVMLGLMDACNLIISDSGGIQEEAPSLGKMVLVTRSTSERKEGIEEGYAELVGTDEVKIIERADYYLDNPKQLDKKLNPYGSGNAAGKIVDYLQSL
jgi:UDP-N-acetylglucosamine 2-epimerase (non-hydrolysing)